MKCPKCGFVNSQTKQNCSRCSEPLNRTASSSQTRATPPVPAAGAAEPPDWRREVSQKVKAYGERRKNLTTPPGPLKSDESREAPVAHAKESREARIMTPVLQEDPEPSLPEPPPSKAQSMRIGQARISEPHPERAAEQQVELPHRRVENEWLEIMDEEETAPFDDAAPEQRHLGRRAASFIVDHTILVVLYGTLLFALSLVLDQTMGSFRAVWPSVVAIFLFLDCMYYVYFYKTSRQTPGQVFFSLELRDPSSSRIGLGKILIRWLAMVGLNVLNFVPAFGGGQLLLDRLSGTEIRSLK